MAYAGYMYYCYIMYFSLIAVPIDLLRDESNFTFSWHDNLVCYYCWPFSRLSRLSRPTSYIAHTPARPTNVSPKLLYRKKWLQFIFGMVVVVVVVVATVVAVVAAAALVAAVYIGQQRVATKYGQTIMNNCCNSVGWVVEGWKCLLVCVYVWVGVLVCWGGGGGRCAAYPHRACVECGAGLLAHLWCLECNKQHFITLQHLHSATNSSWLTAF